MSHVHLTYTPYQLPLHSPLATARGSLSERRGVILALFDASGNCGIGEAAPWPEFGSETQAELEASCVELAGRVAQHDLPCGLHELAQWLAHIGLSSFAQPALSFALECAAAALLSQRAGTPLHTLLRAESPSSIEVNGFTSLLSPTLHAEVAALRRAGLRSVKFKVGAVALERELDALRALRAAFPELGIRLDANNAWTFDDAADFCSAASDLAIEYLEDPLKHTHPLLLKRLATDYSIPLAVDECFRDDLWRETRIKNGIFSTLILKPALHGLSTRTPRLAALAKEHSMNVVMTSFFDSSVGIAYAAHAAAAFGSSCAHGLHSATLFASDTLVQPLFVTNGALELPAVSELSQQLRPDLRRALRID